MRLATFLGVGALLVTSAFAVSILEDSIPPFFERLPVCKLIRQTSKPVNYSIATCMRLKTRRAVPMQCECLSRPSAETSKATAEAAMKGPPVLA